MISSIPPINRSALSDIIAVEGKTLPVTITVVGVIVGVKAIDVDGVIVIVVVVVMVTVGVSVAVGLGDGVAVAVGVASGVVSTYILKAQDVPVLEQDTVPELSAGQKQFF